MDFAAFDKNILRKHDSHDPRLSSFLTEDPAQAQIHILGYPDDEGIRLNGGRTGAHQGPLEIRRAFYKMTPGPIKLFRIWDGGDVSIKIPLSERHQKAAEAVQKSLAHGSFLMTMGGGHDYGYPDGKGFMEAFRKSKKKPVVLNFDAHLDVRPTDSGLSSGTPFFRLLEEFEGQFHFFEVGIQDHCNAQGHIQWCEEKKGKILYQKQIEKQGLVNTLKKSLAKFKSHPAFISVDIDGFSSAVAPGCSQSWPTGFEAHDFFQALEFLFRHLDVKNIGIYEVAPPLESGPLTSRLAALILYRSLLLKGLSHERTKRLW